MSIPHRFRTLALPRHACAATILLALWPCTAAEAAAQSALPARGDVNVSVDAGVAASTRWFRAPGADGAPGVAPTFGAGAELALAPAAALRLHGAFARQHVTSAPIPSAGITARRVDADLLFYDLSLAARPFAGSGPGALRHVWISAGAGAVTTWFRGDTSSAPGDCRGEFALSGVCVPRGATTRPQATAGVGIDLVPLTPRLSVFAALDVHVYRPPVRELSIAADGVCDNPAVLCAAAENGPSPARDIARPSSPRFQAGPANGATVKPLVGLGRLVLGLRTGGTARRQRGARFYQFPDSLSPPERPRPLELPSEPTDGAPPPPPSTGGYVEVKTATPGAAVYLVPFNRWRRAAMLCRLRPVHGAGSYYQGTTASSVPVNALIRQPVTHFLVVIQGGRYYEEAIQVVNNSVERRQLNMAVDGLPTGCR